MYQNVPVIISGLSDDWEACSVRLWASADIILFLSDGSTAKYRCW
jgi:hypothetical protein